MVQKYRIASLLGQGGMGDVYLALDTFLDREVALKLLPLKRSADPGFRDLMRREAAAGARVRHRNLVEILDGGITEANEVYLVMEYLGAHRTLRHLLHASEGQPMALDAALRIAIQVADGIDACHAIEIWHRDLKPENVVVCDGGIVKVIDFGLARIRSNAIRSTDKSGRKLLTPIYASPEQNWGGKVDAKADIWAFGCLMFEMLTGRQVWQSVTGDFPSAQQATMAMQLRDAPLLSAARPDLPRSLTRLVERCLVKQQAERPTARELARALVAELDAEKRRLAGVANATTDPVDSQEPIASPLPPEAQALVPVKPQRPGGTLPLSPPAKAALETRSAEVLVAHAPTEEMAPPILVGDVVEGAPPPRPAPAALSVNFEPTDDTFQAIQRYQDALGERGRADQNNARVGQSPRAFAIPKNETPATGGVAIPSPGGQLQRPTPDDGRGSGAQIAAAAAPPAPTPEVGRDARGRPLTVRMVGAATVPIPEPQMWAPKPPPAFAVRVQSGSVAVSSPAESRVARPLPVKSLMVGLGIGACVVVLSVAAFFIGRSGAAPRSSSASAAPHSAGSPEAAPEPEIHTSAVATAPVVAVHSSSAAPVSTATSSTRLPWSPAPKPANAGAMPFPTNTHPPSH